MNYSEKSSIGTLIVILIVYWFYFNRVFDLVRDGNTEVIALLPVIIGVVIFMIIVQVTYETIIAIIHRSDEMFDERDKAIEARADRISGYVLAIGIYCVIGYMIGGTVKAVPSLDFVVINLLILSLGLSEIVKYALQIASYRLGF